MKKFASLILTLALAFSLSISASAVEPTMDALGEEAKNDVTINVGGGDPEDSVYYVIVTWGTMNFTYNKANAAQWVPEEHAYSGGSTPGWVINDAATIKVDNHSNQAIKVDATFDDGNGYTAEKNNILVTMYESNGTVPIEGAVELDSAAKAGSLSVTGADKDTRWANAPSYTYKVNVDYSRIPGDGTTTFGVTVEISAAG